MFAGNLDYYDSSLHSKQLSRAHLLPPEDVLTVPLNNNQVGLPGTTIDWPPRHRVKATRGQQLVKVKGGLLGSATAWGH